MATAKSRPELKDRKLDWGVCGVAAVSFADATNSASTSAVALLLTLLSVREVGV
jgi:hypothetical protein